MEKKREMAKIYDVISVGSALIDSFLNSGTKEKNKSLCFPLGGKILIDDIDFSVGGGGANTSSCFSHLGLKAGYLGKIGKGYKGEIILNAFKKNKVDFLGVVGEEPSGYSVILESDRKHRAILTFKGVSNDLKFSEINFSKLKTRLFYFTSMEKESFKSQKKIAEFAKKRGIKIAYNPGIYQIKKGIGYIKSILKNTYVLNLNKDEARMLVKKGDLHKNLSKFGPKIIVISDGENEGGVYDGKYLYRYWPQKTKVKEATGAGDTFGSSFVAGLMRLRNIESAIKVAMINATSVIQKRGAQKGLLNWNQVGKIAKKKKFRIEKEILK